MFAVLGGAPALAQMPAPAPYPPPPPYPGYYPAPVVAVAPGVFFAVTGGALFPNDVNVSSSGTIAGVPATGSGKASFKNGYIVTGLLGFQASPYVGLELEGGYTKFDIKSGTATITRANGATTSAPISGSGNAILGLANLIISPLGVDRTLAPYIGGGGGAAGFHGSGTVGGLAFSTSERTAVATADGVFGVNIAVAPGFKIGTRYRFLWIDSRSSHIDTVKAHSVSLTASLIF
ncbi:MAG TPA: hypothetical protein VF502_20125 [Stellaceae bacterium]